MPKLSPSALKTRIAQLQKQLAAAEANRAPAIAKVRALMKELGVTIDDLVGGRKSSRNGRSSRQADGANDELARTTKPRRTGGKVAVKFRDARGNTWTGRGKTPRWLAEAEAAGTSRETFKVT